MGKVILGTTLSLDGFVADRNGRLDALYPDLEALRQTEFLQESIRTTGAALMGRHAYDMAGGDFTGYEFQVPIFVLTHRPPARAAKGANDKLSFIFVADGVERAVEQARAAAGDKDVTVVGGAQTFRQVLHGGLWDELLIGIAPVILGEGLRLFDSLSAPLPLEQVRVIESPGRTDIAFRRVQAGTRRM